MNTNYAKLLSQPHPTSSLPTAQWQLDYPTAADPVYAVPVHDPRLVAAAVEVQQMISGQSFTHLARVTIWGAPGWRGDTMLLHAWYRVDYVSGASSGWRYGVFPTDDRVLFDMVIAMPERILMTYIAPKLARTMVAPLVHCVRVDSFSRASCGSSPQYIVRRGLDGSAFNGARLLSQVYERPHYVEPADQVLKVINTMINTAGSDDRWVYREAVRDPHPGVTKALDRWRPRSVRELAMQFPHVPSDGDPARVAYTRSVQHGQDDRQTVTSLTKYLTREFPEAKAHEIRDLVATMQAHGTCTILTDMYEMINAVQNGPGSCMVDDDWDVHSHPYRVYDPALGWGLAVRGDPDAPQARALVFEGRTTTGMDVKGFVRTYGANLSDGCTQADTQLAAWLVSQGYRDMTSWPDNTPLRLIDYGEGDVVMPYIDGARDGVRYWDDRTIVISSDGVSADSTTGYVSIDCASCDHCGDSTDEDDLYGARDAYGDSIRICGHCSDNYFTHAHVSRHETAYIPDQYAVTASDGTAMHMDVTSEMGYVQLHDGDWVSEEEAICIDMGPAEGEYYYIDDCVRIECGPSEANWVRQKDAVQLDDGEYAGQWAYEHEAVETVDGTWALESECVLMPDNSYYLTDDGRVEFDDESECYRFVSEEDEEDEEDEELVTTPPAPTTPDAMVHVP